jgi:ferredoxin
MARTLEKRGLMVFAADYREFDRSRLASVDLIIVGSPVYYYDVPCNFRQWLSTMPDIEGVPVAAFVTYGGEGGNQHNAACALMDLMVARKGAPVALETFGNMSTYPPTWTMGYEERILNYSFLPDEATFSRVRTFAIQAQEAASRGRTIAYDTHFDFRDAIKGSFALWAGFKLFSGGYSIDEKKCINCGTCVEKCPVGAVDLPAKSISSDACIACMGCVNNCPVDAINITFMGKRLYGFFEFLKRKKISIKEPAL